MPQKPPMHRNRFQPAPRQDHLQRGSSSSRGYDRTWRKFRDAYLREHPLCVFRNHQDLPHECETAASIVDHVVPLAVDGPRLDPANCRSVCRACHAALTTNFCLTGVNEMPSRPTLAVGGWISNGEVLR